LPVDYDLVIVGNTHVAHLAALTAAKWPARVALVRPRSSTSFCAHLYPYALQQASLRQPLQQDARYSWQYAQVMVSQFASKVAPVLLAAQGVDVINSNGEFSRKPQLAFNESRRSLIAKKYLLAMGSQPQIFNIPGLVETGCLTLANLSKVASGEKIPRRWAIIGTDSIGVELAQTLCRLGCKVTLLVESAQVLPAEDADTVAIIQSQLEAAGVILVTQVVVTEVGTQEGAKYLVVNNQNIYVDEIFLASSERPIVESFGLSNVGVEYDQNGILVNNKLETSNSRILACGGVCGKVLGGYYGEHLAEYEANLAVHNALAQRSKPTNYFQIPWVVFSDPQLARVGFTVEDAQRHFEKRLVILQANYLDNPRAMMAEANVGFLKIMVRRSGQIVGATIVGPDAAELMQILALAIRQRLSIEALSDFPGVTLTYTHLVAIAAQQWQRPSRWLQIIDPLLQWQSDTRHRLVDAIDRYVTRICNLFKPRQRLKIRPKTSPSPKS
jgi:pyruvate/2-oxoglutarate dehydrogenase complex dihydrolipoamide dehydrogenase (E3) component